MNTHHTNKHEIYEKRHRTDTADTHAHRHEQRPPQAGSARVVAVSGGFDPVHIGHVRMFNEAKKLGHYLVVIVNNDNWLVTKKGYSFMPEQERKEIIESFRAVDEVILTGHAPGATDTSVCAELAAVHPHIFANGGDRKAENIPEYQLCERLGIEMEFGVGAGGKVQSSSELVQHAQHTAGTIAPPPQTH